MTRPRPYSVMSMDKIESLRVGERLQLMEDLWHSIFVGGGRRAGDLWFPLGAAIAREFKRRWPDEVTLPTDEDVHRRHVR